MSEKEIEELRTQLKNVEYTGELTEEGLRDDIEVLLCECTHIPEEHWEKLQEAILKVLKPYKPFEKRE